MICPYCNTRNTPNSLICAHCGVILKDAKANMRQQEKRGFQNLIAPILIYCTFGLVIGLGGLLLGRDFAGPDNLVLRRKDALLGLEIGFAFGVVLVYLVSAGRFLIFNQLYRRQIAKLSSTLKQHQTRVEKTIAQLEKENPQNGHVLQGIAYLLEDEVDNSIKQFEQAQRVGGHSPELANSFGIALARKGSLDAAVDKFTKALTSNEAVTVPRLNIATAMIQTKDVTLSQKAVGQLQQSLSAAPEDPNVLARLATAQIQAGNTQDAMSNIQKAMEIGGKEYVADCQNLLGVAQYRADNTKEALDSFRASIAVDPGHSHAMANIGVVYLKQKRTPEALSRLTEAVSIDPHQAKARCDFGCALIADSALNEGIREMRQSVVQDPLLIEGHYNLGKVYADQKLYSHAERCYATALKINPRLWQACIGMGVIHYYIGPTERAISWYKEAERLAPHEAVVQGGLALCCALQNDLDGAEKLYLKAIEQDPEHGESLANLGWIYMQLGEIEKAATFTERAIKANSTMAGAYNNMALCNIYMGAFDLALRHFKKANELDSELKGLHYNIGHIYFLLKDQDTAIKEWQISTEIEPGLADAHTNLGVGYFRKGQFDGAIRCFSRVLSLRQDRIDDYANLGLAYARANKHKEAIDQFDQAIAMDPNNPMLHSNRGLACFFAKRVEEAMAEWKNVAHLSADYFKTRSSKQQSEYDESAVEYVQLTVTERAVHSAPSTGDFMFAVLPGYGVDKWEFLINDEDLGAIPALKDQHARVSRSLRALKIG